MEWHLYAVWGVEGPRESRAHQIVPFPFLVRPVVRVLTPASMSAFTTVHSNAYDST